MLNPNPVSEEKKMKSPIALFAPIMLVSIIALVFIVTVADAGGHTTPGGTILDIGDCRSRYCPRNTLGMDSRPRPRRTVEELFGFGGGRNYNDEEEK